MPWLPELFSAQALADLERRRGADVHRTVRFFDGLVTGELDALIESFAGEPELHHPVRGRIRGRRAFVALVEEMNVWLGERNASVEDVALTFTKPRGVEEVIVHLEGENGHVALPVAIVIDHRDGRVMDEVRVYFSGWALTGIHQNRPPLLQPDSEVAASDVVGEYQRALAAGDADAIVATFEEDGYAREPAGSDYLHRGADELRGFYEQLFSNGGGIPLEHCTVTDDGRACALEYNVARWGRTELSPQAGVAVYVRGESGKLAAARIYDDADPPLAATA
jgi:hypothetical protein